jgi:hypothetical protein
MLCCIRLFSGGLFHVYMSWGFSLKALVSHPAASRARAAAYDLRVPLLHPILKPFRAITQVAAVVSRRKGS